MIVAERETQRAGAEMPARPRVRVLLVEDSLADARLTELSLTDGGVCQFETHVARTLAEALKTLDDGQVDVVLLDLGLPDSFGLETFQRLHAAAPELPVIVLSGQTDEELAVRAVQEGAQDYLTKGRADSDMLARAIRYAVERQRIELALERERELFRTLMEHIPDSIYFKDIQSRFLRISSAQAKLFGFKSTEEAVGKTDFDVFAKEHAQASFEDEQQVIRTGNPLLAKIEPERLADGRLRWALTTKMPFRSKQGYIVGTFGISKDITQIKLMEEEIGRGTRLNSSHRL